jgi:hypothetical protein
MTLNAANIEHSHILIGNSFPLSLVRRNVRIENSSLEALQAAAADSSVESFWGHENTLNAVEKWSGLALRPKTQRPALQLDEEGRLCFEGRIYAECWVLSPDYRPGLRHAIDCEVQPEAILGWHVLHILWE